MKTYNVWRSKPNCEPIEGTDKVYSGKSKRSVMKHVAWENKVEINEGDIIVRLPNGEFFSCSLI